MKVEIYTDSKQWIEEVINCNSIGFIPEINMLEAKWLNGDRLYFKMDKISRIKCTNDLDNYCRTCFRLLEDQNDKE